MSSRAQIDVVRLGEGRYEVLVDAFTKARSFDVTLGAETYQKLARGRSHEEFVRDCFRFLLEHEPMESILEQFDISVISNYFPEFEEEISKL